MSATGTYAFTLTEDDVLVLQKLITVGLMKSGDMLSQDEMAIANILHGRVVELWGRVIQRQACNSALAARQP